MENAFKILGAEPTDTAEQLNEILEDKQLLLDDATKEQAAYTELCNPKKRLKHEITYLLDDSFWDLIKIAEKKVATPTIGKLAQVIIDTGKCFDVDCDEFLDDINGYREDSGYPQIDDSFIIVSAFEEIKTDYKTEVVSYLDRLTDKTVISTFNEIVKITGFQSFFIDDLMAYYENRLSETIESEQKNCADIFSAIEKLCRQFINGSDYSYSVKTEYSKFEKALLQWDNILQPLQVNAQMRGASHEGSADFVHDLRNKVIELCNDSQESLGKLVEALKYIDINNIVMADYTKAMLLKGLEAREQLPQKIAESVELTELLLNLLKLFNKVFAEIELTAEQLRSDIKDITDLRSTLIDLKEKIGTYEYDQYRRAVMQNPESSNLSYTQYKQKKAVEKYQLEMAERRKTYNIWLGILLAVLLVELIVGFCCEITAAGVISVIAFVASAVTMIINNFNQSNDGVGFKVISWIITVATIISTIILLIHTT